MSCHVLLTTKPIECELSIRICLGILRIEISIDSTDILEICIELKPIQDTGWKLKMILSK